MKNVKQVEKLVATDNCGKINFFTKGSRPQKKIVNLGGFPKYPKTNLYTDASRRTTSSSSALAPLWIMASLGFESVTDRQIDRNIDKEIKLLVHTETLSWADKN